MKVRPGLEELGLSTGKRAGLHRILRKHGLGNGTAIFLPYDQGLEHGPRDFFANQAASDPKYVIKLALEGGFNGIAIQIGLAEKFYWEYAGEVPLVLKLNGKTDIPAIDPLSPLNATVEDAVRLGADAVGYTLYVGSLAGPGARLRPAPARPRGCCPARHAADRVVVPSGLVRGQQGRQGLLLRRRLRGQDRQRTGRRRGQGQLPAPGEADWRAAGLHAGRVATAGDRRGGPVGGAHAAACFWRGTGW